MTHNVQTPDLVRAWITLMALSAAATILSLSRPMLPTGDTGLAGFVAPLTGGLVLGLAWLKARVILARYLGLAAAPSWRRGFDLVLALFCLLLLALYLLPAAL